MPKRKIAKSNRAIGQRLSNFVKVATSQSQELANALGSLRSIGEVAIFGGAIRDIALFGAETFRSDIDLVVDIEDRRAIEIALSRHKFSRTAFGGYRLSISSWQVDVWPYKRTWAVVNGYVRASRLEDLLQTTFFNWDAVLYSLESRHLTSRSDYVEALQKRYLDIVLLENPNPLGMVERALRMMMRTGATLSPALVAFMLETLNNVTSLTWSSRRNFINDQQTLLNALKRHYGSNPMHPFSLEEDLPLDFPLPLTSKRNATPVGSR